VIASILIGGALGGLYYYSLKITAFKGSQRSISTELRSALSGFLFRLTVIASLLYILDRFTSVDLPWLVLTLVIVFSFFLFLNAAMDFCSDIRHRRTQPLKGN